MVGEREEARELGLIDRLGNLEDSILWAGRLGGIKGKINTVYVREKKLSFLKYLADSTIKELYNRLINPVPVGGYLYRIAE